MSNQPDLLALYKPCIAMIHLASLPGAVFSNDTLGDVTARAVEEAQVLTEAGFDALLLQKHR